MDIVVLHEQLGMTPDEIVSIYPTLTLADIYAALAYYFDHRDEIAGDLSEDRQLAAELARETPSRARQKLQDLRGPESSITVRVL